MCIRDRFISVIGGSGSGKTTVLKLINGLLIPDQGEIHVQNKDIRKVDQNELRRNIGYVIQSIGLFPHMTIEENIGYVLSLTKQDSSLIQKRVKEMMDIMKLEEQLLNRYPDELSGGQKQRVGIARALASHPKILLMDEPCLLYTSHEILHAVAVRDKGIIRIRFCIPLTRKFRACRAIQRCILLLHSTPCNRTRLISGTSPAPGTLPAQMHTCLLYTSRCV